MAKPALIPIAEGPVHRWWDRAVALVVVVAAIAVIWLLASVQPDARGFGTHEQLGMAPCGWMQRGTPCPTCGVTTAATMLVHLRPWQSLQTQPFGFGLALGGVLLASVAVCCLVRQRSFVAFLTTLPLGTLSIGGLALLLASWLYRYLLAMSATQ